MIELHLSERALQEAAETLALLPAAQAAHLRACPLCQGRVATYQHLFTATASLPPPAFAFDLTASIMVQLPRTQPKPAFPWALGVVAILVLGVVGVFVALFGGAMMQAFQGFSTVLETGLLALVGLLVAGQGLALLARYRQQMSLLTFS